VTDEPVLSWMPSFGAGTRMSLPRAPTATYAWLIAAGFLAVGAAVGHAVLGAKMF
jgi:hypothetical protein